MESKEFKEFWKANFEGSFPTIPMAEEMFKEIALKTWNAAVAVGLPPVSENAEVHRLGDIYQYEDKYGKCGDCYMLARFVDGFAVLVSLDDGNTWRGKGVPCVNCEVQPSDFNTFLDITGGHFTKLTTEQYIECLKAGL